MPNPKKPTKLKIIQGTHRKDRSVEQEPEVGQQTRYDPPESLDGLALKTWQNVMPILCDCKILTDADLRHLELYCIHYSNLKKAQEDVDTEGFTLVSAAGAIMKNPACTVVKEASGEIRALSAALGLDPAARTRINVGKKDEKKGTFGALRKPPPRK